MPKVTVSVLRFWPQFRFFALFTDWHILLSQDFLSKAIPKLRWLSTEIWNPPKINYLSKSPIPDPRHSKRGRPKKAVSTNLKMQCKSKSTNDPKTPAADVEAANTLQSLFGVGDGVGSTMNQVQMKQCQRLDTNSIEHLNSFTLNLRPKFFHKRPVARSLVLQQHDSLSNHSEP